jgi:hypothetical protein
VKFVTEQINVARRIGAVVEGGPDKATSVTDI